MRTGLDIGSWLLGGSLRFTEEVAVRSNSIARRTRLGDSEIRRGAYDQGWIPQCLLEAPQVLRPEAPSTQCLRTLVPKTMKGMSFWDQRLQIWGNHLDPLGQVRALFHGFCFKSEHWGMNEHPRHFHNSLPQQSMESSNLGPFYGCPYSKSPTKLFGIYIKAPDFWKLPFGGGGPTGRR